MQTCCGVRRVGCLLATPMDAAPGRRREARTAMTEQTPLATGPARRRRMVRALGRALLNSTLLIVLYYLLPLDRALDAGAITVLVFGLLALTGLVGWQIRAILRADYPALRAVEGLATTIPLFLLLFAAVYFIMAHAQSAAFTQPLSRTDALYFTVTVFATVGFGDITATTQLARVVVTVQMVADLLVLGVLLKVVVGAVRTGQQRQTTGTPLQSATPVDDLPIEAAHPKPASPHD